MVLGTTIMALSIIALDSDAEMPPETRFVLVRDARLLLVEALDPFTPKDENEFGLIDEIRADAEKNARGFLEEALESDRTDDAVLGFAIGSTLYQELHHPGSATQWIAIEMLSMSTPGLTAPDLNSRAFIIYQIIDAGRGLALMSADDTSQTGCDVAGEALLNLGRTLSDPGLAGKCCLTAANLLQVVDLRRALEAFRRAAAVSLAAKDTAGRWYARCMIAHILARLAREDENFQANAFDAMEDAICQCVSLGVHQPDIFRALWHSIRKDEFLQRLWPLAVRAAPSELRPELLADLSPEAGDIWPRLGTFLLPISDKTADEWLADYKGSLGDYAWMIEEHRTKLSRSQPQVIEAGWDDWAFDHPKLQRALPVGKAFLSVEGFDDLILELSHELTHCLSLMGTSGLASQMLRWSLVDSEIGLWGILSRIGYEFDADKVTDTGDLPQLVGNDASLLGQAEVSLEIETKLQMLEGYWTPWLEGLAVFAESGADPIHSGEALSPLIQVLTHLLDVNLRESASPGDVIQEHIVKEYRHRVDAIEQRISQAIGRQAKYRLETYLFKERERYLAGYLAVRSIVSAWRRRFDPLLAGCEAFELLLAATRHFSHDLLPDLSLPLKDFERELLKCGRSWLELLVSIDPADFDRLRQTDTTGKRQWCLWSRTGVQFRDDQTTLPSLDEQFFQHLASQSERILLGPSTDLDRVPGADPNLKALLGLVADSRDEARQRSPGLVRKLLSEIGYSTIISHLSVLPIARMDAPFWLIPKHQMIMVATRATDTGNSLEGARLQLMGINPGQESFEQLLDEVRRLGTRRLRLVRVAELADIVEHEVVRGASVLFAAYGSNWDWSQVRGLFSGAPEDVFPDWRPWIHQRIRRRLVPGGFGALVQSWSSPAHPSARRSLDALESMMPIWTPDGLNEEYDLSAWIAHLRGQATAVIERRPFVHTQQLASRQLLQFVLGDESVVDHVRSKGLGSISDRQIDNLLQFLTHSGARPISPSTELTSLAQHVDSSIGRLLAPLENGCWDVCAPATCAEGNIP